MAPAHSAARASVWIRTWLRSRLNRGSKNARTDSGSGWPVLLATPGLALLTSGLALVLASRVFLALVSVPALATSALAVMASLALVSAWTLALAFMSPLTPALASRLAGALTSASRCEPRPDSGAFEGDCFL